MKESSTLEPPAAMFAAPRGRLCSDVLCTLSTPGRLSSPLILSFARQDWHLKTCFSIQMSSRLLDQHAKSGSKLRLTSDHRTSRPLEALISTYEASVAAILGSHNLRCCCFNNARQTTTATWCRELVQRMAQRPSWTATMSGMHREGV